MLSIKGTYCYDGPSKRLGQSCPRSLADRSTHRHSLMLAFPPAFSLPQQTSLFLTSGTYQGLHCSFCFSFTVLSVAADGDFNPSMYCLPPRLSVEVWVEASRNPQLLHTSKPVHEVSTTLRSTASRRSSQVHLDHACSGL